MAIQPMALAVQTPEINTMQALGQGIQARQTTQNNDLVNARQAMQNIGSLAFGVMDGNLDGQADPQRWEQALDMLSQSGMNVEAFRGKAHMAPVVAKAAADTLGQLQLAQNERELEQRLREFAFTVSEAAQADAAVARPLTPEERLAWGIPETETRPYSIEPGKAPSPIGGSGQTINVNSGQQDDDFFDALNTEEGKIFAGFMANGQNAARTLAQLDQLEGLLANSPQGFEAAATQFAGNVGIDLGNASGVQAAAALINQMVPAQRPPGSGPMSDADLALFKQSVPRLINQPGGNALIIQTMRAINMYDLELAKIAQEGAAAASAAQNAEEKATIRATMRERVNALQNPLDGFKKRVGEVVTERATENGGDTSIDDLVRKYGG